VLLRPGLGERDVDPHRGQDPGQGPHPGGEGRVRRRGGRALQPLGQGAQQVLLQCGQEGLLGGEVAVEGPHRVAQAARQALEGQRLEAPLGHQGQGLVHDGLAPGLSAGRGARGGADVNHVHFVNLIHVGVKPTAESPMGPGVGPATLWGAGRGASWDGARRGEPKAQ
jgi:hypothetical protein